MPINVRLLRCTHDAVTVQQSRIRSWPSHSDSHPFHMAVTIKDSAWLRNQLATALGWELSVAEGVAEAIAAANSQAEVDELVQVCMALPSPPVTAATDAQSVNFVGISGLYGRQ